MHEASIAQGIRDATMRALPSPFSRVRGVRVVTGVFSGCERESLTMYFTELSKGTPLEGAELEVVRQPARLICQACGFTRDYHNTGDFAIQCERCGEANRLEGGNELYLESMEIDEGSQ